MEQLTNLILLTCLLSLTWFILIQKGGLLQIVPQYLNIKHQGKFYNKALLCPHCFAGQLGLWLSLYQLYNTGNYIILLTAPISINIVYLMVLYIYLKDK